MYKRLSAVLFPVLAVLLTGALYWGYQEHQEKNSILIKAENQYQRAFHDLTFHVEKLQQQLGNTLAVNSTSQAFHRKGLVNVWRLTSQAQNEISQLPLTLLPFSDAEDFLSRISNFAYKTAVRDLTKEPLTEDEYETMKTLYAKAGEITKDLQDMQGKVLAKSLRWMDVEIALAAAQAKDGNAIIDGFRTVDQKVREYPEINWGPAVASMYEKRSIKMLAGEPVDANAIKEKAATFFGVNDPNQIKVVENGAGTDYASYTATIEGGGTEKSGRQIQADYTKQGGELIYFMNPRELGDKAIGMGEAKQAADKFLVDHGYESMKAVSHDASDSETLLTYVALQGSTLIYPDLLTVKVAMDNGEVIGLQATEYVYKHKERQLPEAAISSEEARKMLNPSFKLANEQMALIKSDLGEEVLCYEFTGEINGGTYRIYVNAQTGLEENIEQVHNQPTDAQ